MCPLALKVKQSSVTRAITELAFVQLARQSIPTQRCIDNRPAIDRRQSHAVTQNRKKGRIWNQVLQICGGTASPQRIQFSIISHEKVILYFFFNGGKAICNPQEEVRKRHHSKWLLIKKQCGSSFIQNGIRHRYETLM